MSNFSRIAPHNSYHHPWASRDYEDLDCQAVGCMFNRQKKCSVPSLCKIGDDGRCQGFRVPPVPRGLHGD
jgi:hypothetical protein